MADRAEREAWEARKALALRPFTGINLKAAAKPGLGERPLHFSNPIEDNPVTDQPRTARATRALRHITRDNIPVNMAHSPLEEASRTATVGRKRKQPQQSVYEGAASSVDKRQKLGSDDDYVPLNVDDDSDGGERSDEGGVSLGRRGSKESGEVSTSTDDTADLPPDQQRQTRSGTRSVVVNPRVTPIDDEPGMPPAQQRSGPMPSVGGDRFPPKTIHDTQGPLRSNLQKRLQNFPTASIESLLRDSIAPGMPFNKRAIQQIRAWETEHKTGNTLGHSLGGFPPLTHQTENAPADVSQPVKDGRGCGRYPTHTMSLKDIPHSTYPALWRAVNDDQDILAGKKTVSEALYHFVKTGHLSKQAKKCLDHYAKTGPNWSKRSAETVDGDKPGEPSDWSIKELAAMYADPANFFRPMHVTDLTNKRFTGYKTIGHVLMDHRTIEEALLHMAKHAKNPKSKQQALWELNNYADLYHTGASAEGSRDSSHTDGEADEDGESAPQPHADGARAHKGNRSLEELKAIYKPPANFSRAMKSEDLHGTGLWTHLKSIHAFSNDGGKIERALLRAAKKSQYPQWQKKAMNYLNDFADKYYLGPPAGRSLDTDGEVDEDGENALQNHADDSSVGDAQSTAKSPDNARSVIDIYSDESEDEDASVGDAPDAAMNDYGSLARAAASASHDDRSAPADALTRLDELDEEDQKLQYRYFRISDPAALVRCLSCGTEGHMEDECPARTCEHCGAVDEHFSAACPIFIKCSRCRQRGHDARKCRYLSVKGGTEPCDVCGEVGHVEEECSRLWRTFDAAGEGSMVHKIAAHEMVTACFNCGRDDHWGDDCPELPAFLRRKLGNNRTWSKVYVAKFVQAENAEEGEEWGGESSDGGYDGRSGAAQAYQLAALDEMRD